MKNIIYLAIQEDFSGESEIIGSSYYKAPIDFYVEELRKKVAGWDFPPIFRVQTLEIGKFEDKSNYNLRLR